MHGGHGAEQRFNVDTLYGKTGEMLSVDRTRHMLRVGVPLLTMMQSL